MLLQAGAAFMFRSYWLLVFSFIFGCSCVRALPPGDQNWIMLTKELRELFQEPVTSHILEQAENEYGPDSNHPADFALLNYSRCEEDTPRNCLLSYYQDQYHNGADTNFYHIINNQKWFEIAISTVYLGLNGLLMLYFQKFGVNLRAGVTVLSLYVAACISVLSTSGVDGFYWQSYLNSQNEFLTGMVVESARADYLQLIHALLATSFTKAGATIQQSVTAAMPARGYTQDDTVPVVLNTLATYTSASFSGQGRQIVMLNSKMKPISSFRIFVQATDSGGIELTHESDTKRYTLLASHFDLSPLLTLMNKAGVNNVQLMSVDHNFSYQ